MEIYKIHSLRLAKRLINEGCNLYGVEINRIRADRTIFKFEDTSEFRDILTRLTSEFKETKVNTV